ncbi:MAG TPA: triose-phosphate isomerase [Candidatus Competibacteraceae bacterium]|nr:triose-phosphate isomerase [Candidatus Competibacteraceae bacterium]MCP5134498.1 triose-phosphate isomerase [Gammaproteobacteria bacterium]HPF59512.1 triose-phosphate isomerase [Candidatus Competibacteraceae bacterium]HRY18876.1 triose-phosphate isomerase [Candidatus Competibacteraceae bacterium]
MRRNLVAGNWKMNGSAESIRGLLQGIKEGAAAVAAVDLVVFPPFVYIGLVEQQLTGTAIAWGTQNLSEHASGAYTGEVAGPMLQDFHCTYVIVGHSERRTLYGESDEMVARKFAAARKVNIQPILCVGETLEERDQGVTESVVERQLKAVLDLEGIEAFNNAVIAYEPVWAIGTGRTATPQQAQDVHAFIRAKLAERNPTVAAQTRILYGGSMKAANSGELMAMADIDGGLIGGASLDAKDFLAIARSGC